MRWLRFLLAAAAIAGAVSGRLALDAVADSRPTVGWGDLAWVVVAVAFGTFVVLAFQSVLGRTRALRWGWVFFLGVAVFLMSSGLAALVITGRDSARTPSAFMFLAMGFGMLAGLGAVKAAFGRQMSAPAGSDSQRR